MPSYRFFLLISLLLLTCGAGYAAVVLGSAPWATVQPLYQLLALDDDWHLQLPLTPTLLAAVRHGLRLLTLLLASGLASLLLIPDNRLEIKLLTRELHQTWTGLVHGLRALSAAQRRQVLGTLVLLTILRLVFSFTNTPHDDAASYELFVRAGWLTTSAYYPEPNNHVFSNAISVLFYQVSPGFWWSMRLPVLLISTGGTLFLFAALQRRAGFRVAAVAVLLFSGGQTSLYLAGAGRGYWLLILLAGIVFFSTLELTSNQGRQRVGWTALVVAGALGCYTVPTFAYVLAAAFSWLGGTFLLRRQWQRVGWLIGAAGLTGAAATLLYTPLLLVSGPHRLLGNAYVAALPPAVFWRGLPAYLWHTEATLAGHRNLGIALTFSILLMIGGLCYLARTGRLPAHQAHRLRLLGGPALWFMALPDALILGQRVFPPERVLAYKAFYFFILAGLVVDWLLWRWAAPAHRWSRRLLVPLALLFAAYQCYVVARGNPLNRGLDASYHAGLRWLITQPPGPVLLPEPMQNLFFRFYAHTDAPRQPWRLDYTQQDTTQYRYVVAFPSQRGYFQPQFPFPPVYHNPDIDIYLLPRKYPLVIKPWLRH